MKKRIAFLMALAFVFAMTGSVFAQIAPPTPDWAGTTDISWTTGPNGVPVYPLRVGIVAYCADLYHNAGDTGLQAGMPSVVNSSSKRQVQEMFGGVGRPWFLDGPFSFLGQYGAQNIVDYLAYDDGIDRLRDAQIIDGDLLNPSAQQLIDNFDIVIAYTDNKCGQPISPKIAKDSALALAGFVGAPGKKLLLTGFAFSRSIGFGEAIFKSGLSPLLTGGPGLANCTRNAPCQIGSCAGLSAPDALGPCTPQGVPQECRDSSGNFCGSPTYQPLPATADLACAQFLANVNGPTSSSWATALTTANVASGATLCFNYDVLGSTEGNGVPFLAINAARNIVALNTFPPDRADIQKFWYGCLLGNIVQYFSGDTERCGTPTCH